MKKYFAIPVIILVMKASGQNWKNHADSGRVFLKEEKFAQAIGSYNRALVDMGKDSVETLTYARISNALGTAYYYNGSLKKAENAFLTVKDIRSKVQGPLHPDYLNIVNNLAALYNEMGLFEKAEPLYFEALHTRAKVLGTFHPSYAESCNNLGSFYFQTGQLEKAEPLFIQTKNILEKVAGKKHENYIGALVNLAVLYNEMGKNAQAETLFEEALQLEQTANGKETTTYALTCNNLAILYVDMGQYEKAEALYIQAKDTRAKIIGKEHPDYAQNCDNLAALYDIMGNPKKAEPLYLEAKAIRQRTLGKEHPEYATSCNNLGTFYADQKQYDKALLLLQEAKDIYEKLFGKENQEFATSAYNLAEIYLEMEQYAKAEPLYLEAKSIRAKVLGIDHHLYGMTCAAVANLYWNIGQYEKAGQLFGEAFAANSRLVKQTFAFTGEEEKTKFVENVTGKGGAFYSFYKNTAGKTSANLSYDISLFNRGLILTSSQRLKAAVYNSGDATLLNQYNVWTDLKKQLAYWYAKPKEEHPLGVKDIEAKADAAEKALTKASTLFKTQYDQGNVNWKEIQTALQPHESAIEFISFSYYNGKRWTDSTYYMALVVRKDQPQPQVISLFEEGELLQVLAASGNKTKTENIKSLYLRGAGEEGPTNLSGAVYNLVWQPLEKYLKDITKVYFAPAGLLHRLAFAALPVSDKEVLSDRLRLVQLNTTAATKVPSNLPIKPTDAVVLFGGIQYDADASAIKNAVTQYPASNKNVFPQMERGNRGDKWEPLPGTVTEVTSIKNGAGSHSVNIISGVQATEEALKALDGDKSPAVLHIATHGFFFPKLKGGRNGKGRIFQQSDNSLLRSGLLFAGANYTWKGEPAEGVEDGVLTSLEVSNLYLPNTRLVVLSACETGLGDIAVGEGVYGLQRAFKLAGVQHIVMSLWKVPDAEAAEFMDVFYKHLFTQQTVEDAFHNAQSTMKNKYRNDPYKWAAWVLVR